MTTSHQPTAVTFARVCVHMRKWQAKSPRRKALQPVARFLHRCSGLNEVAGGGNFPSGEVHDRTNGDTGHFPRPVAQPLDGGESGNEGGGARRTAAPTFGGRTGSLITTVISQFLSRSGVHKPARLRPVPPSVRRAASNFSPVTAPGPHDGEAREQRQTGKPVGAGSVGRTVLIGVG